MNLEINKGNYDLIKRKVVDYEVKIKKEKLINKELGLWDEMFANHVGKSFYKNNLIKNIKIDKSVLLLKENSEWEKTNLFARLVAIFPVSLKIETDKESFEMKVLSDSIIEGVDKTESLSVSEFENSVNDILNKMGIGTRSMGSFQRKIYGVLDEKLKQSNDVYLKSELENKLLDFNKDSKNIEKYKEAKYYLMLLLKEHFFKKVSDQSKNKYSAVLNRRVCFNNYAQDYIFYNYLRGKPLNKGLETIKEETIRFKCPYDNYYFNQKNNIFSVLKEIKYSGKLFDIIFKEINELNDEYIYFNKKLFGSHKRCLNN